MENILNHLKKIFKSIAVAFSIYSIIPMPKFVWASEDMEYHLIFFPWVGGVTGLAEWFWMWIVRKAGIGVPAFAAVGVVIPLLITGGFHMDGYLDTMDAVHSWKPEKEKLKIMEDPHIGAFAVVWAGILLLLSYVGTSELRVEKICASWCWIFFLSRTLSGIGVITIPSAKKDGMLQTFADTAKRRAVLSVLGIELVVCAGFMTGCGGVSGIIMMAAGILCFLWYRAWSLRKFGGITGDLAGFFVCVSELFMTLTGGILSVILS